MGCLNDIFILHGIEPPRVIVTDRELALTNAIDTVFGVEGRIFNRILCGWHVDHNVVGHAKKYFRVGLNNNDPEPKNKYKSFMESWRAIVKSLSREIFHERRLEFHRKQPAELVRYCENTWLQKHTDKIVHAWVDAVPHFGHRTSSRVEGSHRVLKQYITTSSGDLFVTYKRILQFWTNQHSNWESKLAISKARVPVAAQAPHFINLVGFVTTFALNRIQKEIEEMWKEKSSAHCPDSCLYSPAWGLPCRHRLRSLVQKTPKGSEVFQPIELNCIHPHWLYDRSKSCYMQQVPGGIGSHPEDSVREPEVISRRRGARAITHSKNGGASSTKRDLISTELIEKSLRAQARAQIIGVAPAPKDQHTVFTSGVGVMVGSGNAAPPEESIVEPKDIKETRKRAGTTTLPMRPSPKKAKKPALQRSYYDMDSQSISETFYREVQPGVEDGQREFHILSSTHTQHSNSGMHVADVDSDDDVIVC